MKKLLLLVFTIFLIGCNSDNPYVTKKRLVILNRKLDTLTILDTKKDIDVIIMTKRKITRKSIHYLPDSTKATTIIVCENEAPIIKALGSKE